MSKQTLMLPLWTVGYTKLIILAQMTQPTKYTSRNVRILSSREQVTRGEKVHLNNTNLTHKTFSLIFISSIVAATWFLNLKQQRKKHLFTGFLFTSSKQNILISIIHAQHLLFLTLYSDSDIHEDLSLT